MKTNATRKRAARRLRGESKVIGSPLPHERDEIADSDAQPRPEIATAEHDVREGQVDTDNYTRLRDVGEAGLRKPR